MPLEALAAWVVPLDRVVLVERLDLAGLLAQAELLASVVLAVSVELAARADQLRAALGLADPVELAEQAGQVGLRLRDREFVGMGGDISTVRKSATMGSMRAATTFVFPAR